MEKAISSEERAKLEAKILEVKEKHPDWGRGRLAKHLKVRESLVNYALKKLRDRELILSMPTNGSGKMKEATEDQRESSAKKTPRQRGISASDFINELDVPQKIRDGLKSLKGCFLPESDFRDELEIDATTFAKYKSLKEFDRFKIRNKRDGKTYWSTAENIERAIDTRDQ